MCFSAEASFAAAAVLLPAGAYCTAVAARRRPAYLPLAVVPLVFSFQQSAEGLVWVGLARGDPALVRAASLAFLAVALGFWPFWVPLSLLPLSGRGKARWGLGAGSAFGLALGCALFVPLARDAGGWLDVTVVHHSIRYTPGGLPAFAAAPHEVWDAAYGAAVFVPFFVTPAVARLVAFRVLLAASAAASLLVFRHAFVSVWCFFAAVLSAQLCYTFARLGEASGREGRAVRPDAPARLPPHTAPAGGLSSPPSRVE
jgi:hypothetical protein